MKYKTLNSLLTIGISLIAVIIALYSFALTSENILEQAVFNHLETVAQAKASHITHYLEKELDTIEASAKNWFFEEELAKGVGKEDLPIVQKELEDLFDVSPDYIELFLLDKKGKVVASTNSEFVGLDESDKKYFTEPKEKMKGYIADVYESAEQEKGAYLISSSVIRRNTGDFMGVLIARINLNALGKITTDRTGLGETGEIYLINKDYFMITPSKFFEDTFLEQKIETESSRNCFGHSAEVHDTGITTDYRGISVLSTHVYIPEKEWCLIVEINEKEILGQQKEKLMKNALIIILALALILVIIGFVIRPLLGKSD